MNTTYQRFACLTLFVITLSTLPTSVLGELPRDATPEDLFALRLVTPPDELIEDQLPLLFQVFSPYDGSPLAAVPIEVEVTLDGDGPEAISRHRLVSDGTGEAHLLVELPATRLYTLDVDIKATATRRGLRMQLDDSVYPGSRPNALVSTDRSLYQPGQTLHARGLWLDSFGRPAAQETVRWEIEDPKGRTLTVAEGRTSDMGVAAFDWTIPSHAEGGDYSLGITPDPNYNNVFFRVRPYEPATLLVDVALERPVVLKGEATSVTVTVRYANGDPIVDATVELFVEPPQNEPPQKLLDAEKISTPAAGSQARVDPAPTYRTDHDGQVVVPLDLTEAFDDLSDDNGMEDLALRVRATDPLSRRSESLDFAQRLSNYPIHLYGVGLTPHRDASGDVAANLFAFAQRADGEPVATWVQVQRRQSEGLLKRLGTVRTNSLGVADLGHLPIVADDDIVLVATAGPNGDGEVLGRSEPYWRRAPDLDLLIPRPLRRPTEAIELTVRGMVPTSRVRLDVYRRQTLVAQHAVPYGGPVAEVRIPYRESFRGPLTIVARDLDPRRQFRTETTDIKVVSYPLSGRQPRLTLHSDRSTYRPGDTARLTLRHQTANADGGTAAVAVAIVDAASHARQVSDALGDDAALLRYLWVLDRWQDPESLTQGGWTLARLRALPADQQFAEAAQLVARGLLTDTFINEPLDATSNPLDAPRRHLQAFFAPLDRRMEPALQQLRRLAPETVDGAASFVAELQGRGVDWRTLSDPWDAPFRVESDLFHENRRFRIFSNGWDRTPGTADDFVAWSVHWPFAKRLGQAITAVIEEAFHDDKTLLADEHQIVPVLASRGITWSEERDPWGHTYFITSNDRRENFSGDLSLKLTSRGPDGLRDADERPPGDQSRGDDIVVWRSHLPWSGIYQGALQLALQRSPKQTLDFSDGLSLRRSLASQGVDMATWKDPWGHPVYFKLSETVAFVDDWRRDAEGRSTPEPVRRVFDVIELWSAGPDGGVGTADDSPVGEVRHPRDDREPFFSPLADLPPAGDVDPERGQLEGRVLTDEGYGVPGSVVTALRSGDSKTWQAFTDAAGRFSLALPVGIYRVQAELEGFNKIVFPEVPIHSRTRTHLAMTLSFHWHTETIIVTAEASVVESGLVGPPEAPASPPTSTPRLRRDFPETLFWLAEGRTDTAGRLRLEVPLADSITTWHVAALASDARGRVSAAEHTLVVDQPFFLQPDVPPLLTVGDAIALPVQVHNKTGHTLKGDLRLQVEPSARGTTGGPAAGLSVLRPTWPAGVSQARLWQTFATPGEGTVRWTAEVRRADGAPFEGTGHTGDAVQETVRVTPRGEQQVEVQSRFLREAATLRLEAPRNALPIDAAGSVGELEIVIYDDLDDHLTGALQGLAHKPTGCAEQITANAWLHLLRREHLTSRGQQDTPEAMASSRFLAAAYQLLGSYRREGGFAYWPRSGEADLALSAMILEFLLALDSHVDVDPSMIEETAAYLTASQRASGAWPSLAPTATGDTSPMVQLMGLRRDALLSHSLAVHAAARDAAVSRQAAANALQRLQAKVGEDPYALAWMILTAGHLGDAASQETTRRNLRRLQALAEPSDGDLFWRLRANTPFYGWGAAGRFETTALAVEALADGRHVWPSGSQEADALGRQLSRGLSFLLFNKGGDGSWATTQASLRVLRSLQKAMPDIPDGGRGEGSMTPSLNGAALPAVATSKANPRRWTLPLSPGEHVLQVPGHETFGWRLVQTRLHHVRPWQSPSTSTEPHKDLHFSVQCPTEPLRVGVITACQVEILRRTRGSGMMIAEIGLPPGAEVDREALRRAMEHKIIQHFEEWPGRLVLYTWPRAEGLKLSLPWRPRLALRAKARPSMLYDYYNPDSRVVLAPPSFVVEPAIEP